MCFAQRVPAALESASDCPRADPFRGAAGVGAACAYETRVCLCTLSYSYSHLSSIATRTHSPNNGSIGSKAATSPAIWFWAAGRLCTLSRLVWSHCCDTLTAGGFHPRDASPSLPQSAQLMAASCTRAQANAGPRCAVRRHGAAAAAQVRRRRLAAGIGEKNCGLLPSTFRAFHEFVPSLSCQIIVLYLAHGESQARTVCACVLSSRRFCGPELHWSSGRWSVCSLPGVAWRDVPRCEGRLTRGGASDDSSMRFAAGHGVPSGMLGAGGSSQRPRGCGGSRRCCR
eukprot:COSAG06_NODE_742_length_12659_cov_504.915127_9_plen_285_part_00